MPISLLMPRPCAHAVPLCSYAVPMPVLVRSCFVHELHCAHPLSQENAVRVSCVCSQSWSAIIHELLARAGLPLATCWLPAKRNCFKLLMLQLRQPNADVCSRGMLVAILRGGTSQLGWSSLGHETSKQPLCSAQLLV